MYKIGEHDSSYQSEQDFANLQSGVFKEKIEIKQLKWLLLNFKVNILVPPKCALGHNDYVWQEGGFSGIESTRW